MQAGSDIPASVQAGPVASQDDTAVEDAVKDHPKWFTPLRLLAIFCFVNVFVYLDRGLIASNGVNGSAPSEQNPNGTGIQGDFALSLVQDGLLPAAFMVGLLISSPVFAEASKQVSAFRLLALGMGVWSLACMGCAASPHFVVLLFCRALVGVGEASFVALAAPFIDDYAPAKSKSRWFAAFYLCIPVGFALGYIVGGVVASEWGWRWAFVLESLAMVPFVVFAARVQPLYLRGSVPTGTATRHHDAHHSHKSMQHYAQAFWLDVKQIMAQRVYSTICVAYTIYVAVLGVYAYWGPQAGKQLFFPPDDESNQADLVFGGVTVLTGVLGSLSGGLLLDAIGSSLRNANLICATSCLVGVVLVIPAFAATKTFAQFMCVFALGQLSLFLLQAPVAAIIMWSVPTALRPLGASVMTVFIHLLGDVPSPPLLGLLQTSLSKDLPDAEKPQKWRVSMSVVSTLLIPAGLAFLLAASFATAGSDFRDLHAASEKQRMLPESLVDQRDHENQMNAALLPAEADRKSSSDQDDSAPS